MKERSICGTYIYAQTERARMSSRRINIVRYMMDLHRFPERLQADNVYLTYQIYLNVELAMLHDEMNYQDYFLFPIQ